MFDSKGNLFLADVVNNRIVKFTPPTGWTVFAGNGTAGNADGAGTAATLTMTSNNLGIDANDNLYVRSPSVFRKIAPDGTVTTITPPTPMTGAGFTVDAAGDIFTVDIQTIYRMSVGGTVTAYPFAAPLGFVTSLAIDKNNNLYAGTQGPGAANSPKLRSERSRLATHHCENSAITLRNPCSFTIRIFSKSFTKALPTLWLVMRVLLKQKCSQ